MELEATTWTIYDPEWESHALVTVERVHLLMWDKEPGDLEPVFVVKDRDTKQFAGERHFATFDEAQRAAIDLATRILARHEALKPVDHAEEVVAHWSRPPTS